MNLIIALPPTPSPVEDYAAEELKKYLVLVHGIEAEIRSETDWDAPTILLGDPRRFARFADVAWPEIFADGFRLKTLCVDPPVLAIGGGMARGTLFGVYEWIERWGVVFLLSGEQLPERPAPLVLTGFDETLSPAYPTRATRPMANVAEGASAWSAEEFAAYIDRAARMKFNSFLFVVQESGPWLDYEFRGVERPAGDIFYGYRFPIDDDFIGKELFPGQAEFYSPVLGQARDERERKRLGIELVRSVIRHCRARGLMSLLTFHLLEPPTLFKHKCNDWATMPLPDPKSFGDAIFTVTPTEELGTNPQFAAWMNLLDPAIRELVSCRMQALFETYPDADAYHLWASEHRSGLGDGHKIFAELDAKYHVTPGFDFAKKLECFEESPFDQSRYQHQMQGDLVFLYALDKILTGSSLLQDAIRRKATLCVAGLMPQLTPLTTKILPEGSVLVQFLDYGAHGPADRITQIVPQLEAGERVSLEIGIQDDNNMYFPQISVESLSTITRTTGHLGMEGYVAALWQIRQADINAAFLARASWHPDTTADEFYREWVPRLVGENAAGSFERALRQLEAVDREIRYSLLWGYGLLLTPNLIPALIKGSNVDRKGIAHAMEQFGKALHSLEAARAECPPGSLHHVAFWASRTRFAMDWLDMVGACAALGALLGETLPSALDTQTPLPGMTFAKEKYEVGAPLEADRREAVLTALDGLIARSESLIKIIAADATTPGDLGQIAGINQFVRRVFLNLRDRISRQNDSHEKLAS